MNKPKTEIQSVTVKGSQATVIIKIQGAFENMNEDWIFNEVMNRAVNALVTEVSREFDRQGFKQKIIDGFDHQKFSAKLFSSMIERIILGRFP